MKYFFQLICIFLFLLTGIDVSLLVSVFDFGTFFDSELIQLLVGEFFEKVIKESLKQLWQKFVDLIKKR